MNETQLYRTAKQVLTNRYDKVIDDNKNYIVAVGDIPVALVAHLDTVFDAPAPEVFYDMRKGVCWSNYGLGADDRAGVFAIFNLLQRGLRPSVIFLTGEEEGGIGATALAKMPCPIPNLKYMIELDRQGENDMVFYQCYSPGFIDYIERFGFLQKKGSYSDISFLMEAWQICGVNLSIGYKDEHSYMEMLYVDAMFATINKVDKMLREAKTAPRFDYGENSNPLLHWHRSNSRDCDWDYDSMTIICPICGDKVYEFETIDIEGQRVCADCFDKYMTKETNKNGKRPRE